MEATEQFLQWVEESGNIVFLVEQGYRPRAESRISVVWTVCIINSISIRRRLF